MKRKSLNKQQISGIKICLVFGVIVSLTYPLMITTHGYGLWPFFLEMTFGTFFLIGCFGLYCFIKHFGDSIYNQLALIFNSLAAGAVTMMLMVQKSVYTMGMDIKK